MIKKTLIYIIRIYQFNISPWLAPCCRFIPTCSQYGIESINRFGVLQGIWFTIKRILKCSPFSSGGIDNIPEKNK